MIDDNDSYAKWYEFIRVYNGPESPISLTFTIKNKNFQIAKSVVKLWITSSLTEQYSFRTIYVKYSRVRL